MSQNIQVTAQKREGVGKGAARAIRREGLIPGVLYGDKKEPMKLALENRVMVKLLHTPHFFNTLVDIKIDKDSHRAIARDVQLDPVKDTPIHVDFLRVTDRTVLNIDIPLAFLNEESCPGLERGGVLSVVRHSVEMTVRANNIPEQIEVDLTGLEIGDSISISDITLPKGAELTITDRDFTLASVTAPSALRSAEDEAEEGEEAESEETSEDKTEDEG